MTKHNTAIEWTHRPGTKGETWNPLIARRDVVDPETGETKRLRGWHCEHATTGCINCYSEKQNITGARGGTRLPYKPGHRKDISIELHEPTLLKPMEWKSPRTLFVCSMTDLFGAWHTDEMIDRVFAVMALRGAHTFIVLTKRSERMRQYISRVGRSIDILDRPAREIGYALKYDGLGLVPWPLPNVWLGVSAEDQERANERIPDLLATPAAVRFVSAEPLLGPIDFTSLRNHAGLGEGQRWLNALGARGAGFVYEGSDTCSVPRVDWVIVGGESGRYARPMHPQWARSIRDQCQAAGATFFFKQFGEWAPYTPVPGGDLGGEVRAGRVRIVHPSGRSDVEVSEATGGRSTEPGSRYMVRVGKKAAGRRLDDRTWDEFPGTRT